MANIFTGRINREYYLTSQYLLGLVLGAFITIYMIMFMIAMMTLLSSTVLAASAHGQTTEDIQKQAEALYGAAQDSGESAATNTITSPDSYAAVNPQIYGTGTASTNGYTDFQNDGGVAIDAVTVNTNDEGKIAQQLTNTALGITGIFTGAIGISFMLLFVVCLFIFFILQISLNIRRLHDLGHTGWMTLFMFVPLVNIVLTVYLSLAKGHPGDNQYGPDTRGSDMTLLQALFNT